MSIYYPKNNYKTLQFFDSGIEEFLGHLGLPCAHELLYLIVVVGFLTSEIFFLSSEHVVVAALVREPQLVSGKDFYNKKQIQFESLIIFLAVF